MADIIELLCITCGDRFLHAYDVNGCCYHMHHLCLECTRAENKMIRARLKAKPTIFEDYMKLVSNG